MERSQITESSSRDVVRKKSVLDLFRYKGVWETCQMNGKEQQQTGRRRLSAAFKTLRSKGWFARMNFECCTTCGWAVADKTGKENVVFFHSQSNDRLEENGQCYLHWQGDAKTLITVLERHGIKTTWDEDENTAIMIDVSSSKTA